MAFSSPLERVHSTGLSPGDKNDITKVTDEIDNIIDDGVNEVWDRGGDATDYSGTRNISVVENATQIDTNSAAIAVNASDIDDLEELTSGHDKATDRIYRNVGLSGDTTFSWDDIEDYDVLILQNTSGSSISVTLPTPTADYVGRKLLVLMHDNPVGQTALLTPVNETFVHQGTGSLTISGDGETSGSETYLQVFDVSATATPSYRWVSMYHVKLPN